MEIDFGFMSRGGLVIGEAKSASGLDGKDEAERLRDVGKSDSSCRHSRCERDLLCYDEDLGP